MPGTDQRWDELLTVALVVAGLYVVLLTGLLVARPRGVSLTDAVRLVPDLLRLLRRLTADRSLPRGIRLRLWFLLGYLALPFDVVPDFLPVIGQVDDVVVVALVLRSVVRRAGPQAVRRHWPGTDEGLRVVLRLAGVGPPP